MVALRPTTKTAVTSMRVVFWHNYLMFHQAPYIRALADRDDVEVHWAVSELLPESFRQRGYPVPDVGRAQLTVAPDDDEIGRLLDLGPGTVHVFFGFRGMPLARRAFELSKSRDVRRILMSENRYEPGIALLPRWLMYAFDATINKRWLEGFLCIGFTGRYGGRRFFSRCGYPVDRIYPFLHLVEPPAQAAPRAERGGIRDEHFKILFVGQLIQRKRVDLLFKALSGIADLPWSLTVVGSGELREKLGELAVDLGIGQHVTFLQNMGNAEVFSLMTRSDALVLPSRFDGWGAVVSEALASGLPVVCSDRCGASDLLIDQPNGYVFRADSAQDLEKGIRYTLTSKEVRKGEALRNWSTRITGHAAANYFVEVVSHLADDARPAPRCPWIAPSVV